MYGKKSTLSIISLNRSCPLLTYFSTSKSRVLRETPDFSRSLEKTVKNQIEGLLSSNLQMSVKNFECNLKTVKMSGQFLDTRLLIPWKCNWSHLLFETSEYAKDQRRVIN